ncbi:golgin subfamily B member 1 isoform X2 [Embiotoca jacksoni]|uniref:golgin subfamily B member 1 isoform X2 n=1 Tax=Embiotoca jacksoni TaxID=100190 RepID=UPI003703E63A
MLKWFSGEEGEPGSAGPGFPHGAGAGGEVAVEEMVERLTQTELLVSQLKEMIREKDATLRSKDEQLKGEKEACEAKLSKLRLQNKAKVTSLTTQLEELKTQQGGSGTPTRSKKGSSEGEQASRGKIVLLKKKVEELEQQLTQRDEELQNQRKELESRRQRGEEMDAMLTERDRKLSEKEAYIVHLQTALGGDQPAEQQKVEEEEGGALAELQLLVQSLTKKVGESEERYSLLQEQTESLKELLVSEKQQYGQKESMYKQNIQTFKDILMQKDNQLTEINHMHEQELFKLAAKSDARADIEQLLKALKQKLHEKEEVLLGKTQVIDVLQGEVDGRDQQIKELSERLQRLQVERESLESKMEAEKHVMRAQLRDLMEKQQAEVWRITEQHQAQMDQTQQDLLGQLEELRRAAAPPACQEVSGSGNGVGDSSSVQRIAELEAQTKQKSEEASRSEAKFLKMKAWSKSRIRQLEEELKKSQAGVAPPDLNALRSRITALEEEREENLWRVEQYEELRAQNGMLEEKLVVYEEQQRTLQADLEQVTKRAASQASESGSADDAQSHVLEWQEMVAEAVSARDRAREEKAAMVLRISHMDEEREALATRQQELEEELAQARGLGPLRAKKLAAPAQRSLQEDFEFDGQASFQDPRSTSESTTPMEGENMGGWWPEYSSPDTDGLRSVVEELELERNQLQEQILSLEERCQGLEDRLQLQARIEALQVTFDVDEDERPCRVSQNESEKLLSQLAGLRAQQSRDAEKHQLLVSSLNEQIRGLSDTQECLESSLLEKENTLAKTSEKLQLISSLRESLSEREAQSKELSEKLLQTEHSLENVSKKSSSSEKQCCELKAEVVDLTQRLSVLKDKTQKQEVTVETLQTDLDQTNEELDKLNSAHLEERAQLIHDLQSCEREIDGLRDTVQEKDREICSLASNMAEYSEQVTVLKQEIRLKEESLVRVEDTLSKAEQEASIIRDSQTSDQQALNGKITELVGKLQDTEAELNRAREDRESRASEAERLVKQADEDERTIRELRGEIHKHTVIHRTHISSLKEQLMSSVQKIQDSEALVSQLQQENSSDQLQELKERQQTYDMELKALKEERNNLLAQLEKHQSDVQTLSRQLEEQESSKQQKLETIAMLEKQVEDERRDNKKQSESISKLKNLLKNTKSEKQQELKEELEKQLHILTAQKEKLKEELEKQLHLLTAEKEKLKEELEKQLHLLTAEKEKLKEELEKQLHLLTAEKEKLKEELEKQLHLLTAEKEKLKEELEKQLHLFTAEKEKLKEELEKQLHLLTAEKEKLEEEAAEWVKSVISLQDQISVMETQQSENSKVVEALEKENQELTVGREELKKVLEQSTHSNSQMLLDKTNECSDLKQLLRRREEELTQLQSESREKEDMLKQKQEELQREVTTQRSITSELQAKVETLEEKRSRLRKQLEEREEQLRNTKQKHQDQLNHAKKSEEALREQILSLEEVGRNMEAEAQQRETKSDGLKRHMEALREENRQLQAARESKGEELADLDARLTQEKLLLQEEVSGLTADRNLLQEKYFALQVQTSDSQRRTEGLLKEKEEQLQSFQQQVGQLSAALNSREQSGLDLRSQLQTQQNQLVQLQDTVSTLQQQGVVLKEALQQRTEEAAVHQQEVLLHKDLLSETQREAESLRKEAESLQRVCSEARQQTEQREEALKEVRTEFQRHKEELDKRNESVVSLSSQLGAMNQSAAQMEAEVTKLKASGQKTTAEILHLNDSIAALSEQNTRLETELQRTETELQRTLTELSEAHGEVDGVRAAAAERESLQQGRQETLQRQEIFIQQLSRKMEEKEEQVLLLRESVCKLTAESSTLKNTLQEKEQSSLESSAAVHNLSSHLQTKEAECESLKEQTSHLEEAVSKLTDSLQVQTAEAGDLRRALEEQTGSLQRRAEETLLFKDRFTESTESVSRLQTQVQSLSSESEMLRRSAAETQSAFNNLREKFAVNLEELQEVRRQLSQRTDELSDSNNGHQATKTTVETLREELSAIRLQLENTDTLNRSLSKEKEEALSSHQASVSLLTLETERLKSQQLQVAAQMDALTENLEQREMALHAINSQYTAQAKHGSQLLSEIQKLEEQNQRLHEGVRSKEAEHRQQNAHLQDQLRKVQAEKEELERRQRQVKASQAQMEQRSSSMSQEKQSLHEQVSAKQQEVCELRESVEKIEQVLQDSEREWLLVLDREKQDRNLLAEQLKSVEGEMKSKDVKVHALKQDLDSLQEKLAEASSAIRRGSDQLGAKETEASASRVQLERVLESIQEKEAENQALQQAVRAAKDQLKKRIEGQLPVEEASLQEMIQLLEERHQSEVDTLKQELDKTLHEGQRSQQTVELLQAGLSAELQTKEEQIGCMNIQIGQQKDLLAGLSQQLKDKDASIAQVMESASSERMKLGEEKSCLLEYLQNTKQESRTWMERLEETTRQLQEVMSRSGEEKLELTKEKKNLRSELNKVSKEKDAVKKKLQAALVVRKDLLKRIEELEKQKEESAHDKTEVSLLQDQVTNQAKTFGEHVSLLEEKLVEKDAELVEVRAESGRLMEQLQTETQHLESSLKETEERLTETLQTLGEKDVIVEQLQADATATQEALMQKVEEMQIEMKTWKDELKEKSSSASSAVQLENEMAQMKLEKAALQKKAQAALLARRDTMRKAQEREEKLSRELGELKDDYKALLEQRCQQTNERNAVQLDFDEKIRELEDLRQHSLSYVGEVETLRQLVDERDETLQALKVSLAEKENQCHSLSHLQSELDTLTSRLESVSLDAAGKNQALVVLERQAEDLKSKLHLVEKDLEEAQAEAKERTEEVQKYQETIRDAELKTQQENEALISQAAALERQLNISQSALDQLKHENQEEHQILMAEKQLELESIQKTSAETQQLEEDRRILSEELEEARRHAGDTQKTLELLQREKETSVGLMDDLRDQVTSLSRQLKEAQEAAQQLRENTSETRIKQEDCFSCKTLDEKLKEKDEALSVSQAQLSDKQELIAALELRWQQQTKMQQVVVEKMRTDTDELQRSREEGGGGNDRDSQSRAALLTRKLQAALVSRKELLKENAALKEEVEKLSALESSMVKLKQQNTQLEICVSSVTKEKEKLSSEVDRILNDNRSLSAACESLKMTIENITQQKQAFSCQLESLKDSQTEELSKWKSEHAELRQEYESLLQAYENVSSEMDKMRQLLEGAKRERQEALRQIHKQETEMESLETTARETEEENNRMKERMQKYAKEKRLKIEELEEQNEEIRKELTELDGNHEKAMLELRDRNQRLEAETCRLKESSEVLRVTLSETQEHNSQLAERLREASCSLEKKDLESNTYTNNMQIKLDEALRLNNSLTAQIEAQTTELGAQLEINNLLQKEKQNLSVRMEEIQNDHEVQLGKKDEAVEELKDFINRHRQETVSLNEKVRILEDDKSLLQEELENVQEASDKVKNENEYLETVILKNSERMDELTESVSVLQNQNTQLSARLAASEETNDRVRQEKEREQLKLVRELEDKLRTVRRGNEGSKNVKKELQELLREKHQEINQLQQNCIRYQELILDLETSLKGSQSARHNLERDLKKSSERMSALEETSERVEDELATHKNLLKEAEEKMETVRSERDQLAVQAALQNHTVEETKAPQTVQEPQMNSYRESQLQQQVEDLKELKDEESRRADELRQQLDSQHLQINTLKRTAETTEAKLSAVSSTAHGAEATRRWTDLYQRTLHEKDTQLLEQGFIIKRFLEDMRVKDKEVSDLRVSKSRLERTLNEYSVAAAAQQRQLFVMSAGNAELGETAELLTLQVKELGARVERTERDKNTLHRQLADKDDVTSRLQLRLQQLEKMNADAQLFLLRSHNDKLQADFEKQEGISLQLKTLLQNKDAEISSLLSCKDGQMSGYLEQLQANYRSQVSVYEDRLTSLRYQREKADKELRGLEAKVKGLQINLSRSVQEKEQMAAKMESFKNSMVSLQSERERLMSEYRILEAKSQLGLKGREGSTDGEGGATKGLKHEIRKLLHQMDDLNSENAMLRAQLVRYREDLNQVLSLKDNQLKVLLKKQQDVIKNLEHQKAAAEKQHRESRLELQKEEETSSTLNGENSRLKARVSQLEAEVSTQRKERATTDEGKVICDLQEAVAAKAAECNDLQQKLLSQRVSADELQDKMQLLESETDKKLSEAEDKYNGELDAFEREVEQMRTEREAADQRLAELAKDLLETEQQVSEAASQSKDVKAQNESLCRAMVALQNDRDQLIQDFKVLRNRYDQELRDTRAALNKVERSLQDATSDLAAFAKERDVLLQKMKALESEDAPAELNRLLDELSAAASEKERQLEKVTLENNTYSKQLAAFSRSMASLQNDRDRMLDELAGAKRAVESRQGSSPGAVTKGGGVSGVPSETDGPVTRQKMDKLQQTVHKEVGGNQEEPADVRCVPERTDLLSLEQEAVGAAGERGLQEAERMQLHRDLQRCLDEIQQRDHNFQQLGAKLQQAVEEKAAVAAHLRAVSQTLRDTQDRYHWLEGQVQGQVQGSVYTEVAPGAPQERNSVAMVTEAAEVTQLRERLLEVELSLSDERGRRETVEEALRVSEDRLKSFVSGPSRDAQRDFSIEVETEEEWDALSLNPNQPLITRKVKGGMVACRRWLRGRSLYFSRLLTGRARSRYLFLAYMLALHVLILMCLSGAL